MDVLRLLDELRVLAQAGLFWAERNDHPYDKERYERILELVAQQYDETLKVSSEEVHERLTRNLGYVTPNIGVKAAIFDEEGRILLMERPDEPVKGTWDIPGGAVEPFEGPAETAVRETREETGLDVETVEVVDAYPMESNALNPHGHVLLLYLCKKIGGTLQLSREGMDLRYWGIEDVPEWTLEFQQPALDARQLWAKEK
ncbi:NUDIX hydrolase N-terminal domain-containing protein [Halococcus sp. AFM35]|uniref:NUDIX hydrolase N-terminal domain-containing protein n=1 Tax=Halococcus sp. AFM35 TaxID=3421653 RepID=UPI003EC0680C